MDLGAALFEGLRWGAVGSAFTLGLRHGFDWDHIAAITDITGAEDDNRRSLLLSSLYILGHALVVTVLGLAAIAAGSAIPDWLDGLMGRVVGATLIALGVYVLVSLVRHGRDARLRSRWMLAASGVRTAAAWVRRRWSDRRAGPPAGEPVVIEHEHDHEPEGHHDPAPGGAPVGSGEAAPDSRARAAAVAVSHRHRHVHLGTVPDDPFAGYSQPTAFGIGMLHGVGAETPTQMVLFASAAGAATAWGGAVFLAAFVVGLTLANTAVALGSRVGVLNATRNFTAFAVISVVVAALSLYLGTVFVLDAGEGLPGLFT